jgi:hypothetical protein
VHGIDYDDTFTPLANMDSICLEHSIAATKGWEFHQMDMKNAFLHGYLSEEIYMEQPQGFMHDSSSVYQLKKSLYGLKKTLRAWYTNRNLYIVSQT